MDVVDSLPVLVASCMPGRLGKYTGGQVTNFSPVLVHTISTSCLEQANCGHKLHLSDVKTYLYHSLAVLSSILYWLRVCIKANNIIALLGTKLKGKTN